MNPTRARGQNEPHILDLVLNDDKIIDDIEYLSPQGKSDHAVLFLTCKYDTSCKTLSKQIKAIQLRERGLWKSL